MSTNASVDARGGQNPRRAVRRIVGRKIGVDATKKRGSPCMENCPSGIVSARATEKGSAERERESDRERGPRERERERRRGASETENGAGARETERGREQDSEWNSRSNKQRT